MPYPYKKFRQNPFTTFFSCPIDRQTDRQTDRSENVSPFGGGNEQRILRHDRAITSGRFSVRRFWPWTLTLTSANRDSCRRCWTSVTNFIKKSDFNFPRSHNERNKQTNQQTDTTDENICCRRCWCELIRVTMTYQADDWLHSVVWCMVSVGATLDHPASQSVGLSVVMTFTDHCCVVWWRWLWHQRHLLVAYRRPYVVTCWIPRSRDLSRVHCAVNNTL